MMDLDPVHLEIERHTLANGLEVVLHRDRSLPLIALNIWYHVGSKNETVGKTGFAHLFEHLLFQGSEHVDTNGHFRLVQQAGGTANGSTWYDRTNYHCVLPAHQLDLGLWLEADRMGFFLPSIHQEKLENQREVVINERRQRVDNQPYGRAFERLQELVYPPGHPYRWPVIGYMDDIEAATLDDVRAFFEAYYVPNNAVLTLAGDFDEDALERIDRYFGSISRGPEVRQPEAGRRPRGEERRDVLPDRVELARLYLGFQVPPYGTREWYTADLLAAVLADGKSSRMYEDLVYRRQLAQDVSCFVLPTEIVSTFAVIATVAAGGDVTELEEAIRGHLVRIAEGRLGEEHVERSRNRLLLLYFHQFQTLERRADLISHFTTFFDAPEKAAQEVRIYQELTAEDLAAFVRDYLDTSLQAVVTVVPEHVSPPSTPPRGRESEPAEPGGPIAASGEAAS